MTVDTIGILLGSAVIAALVSAGVSVLLQYWTTYLQEIARRRDLYAKALAACAAYREFPFAIRRRRPDDPVGERQRLSEAIRAVQQDLSFYAAWIQSESIEVSAAYAALLATTRRIAGGYMQAAWTAQAPTTDAEMNISGIDYSEIGPLETAYLDAVRQHLTWLRRIL
jgi:hypothetical protein